MSFGVAPEVDFWIFIKAVGLGYLLGFVYSTFELFLKKINNRLFFAVVDFLFLVSSAFLSFIFVLDVNFGVFRCYIPIGEIVGFCLISIFSAKHIKTVLFFLHNKIKRKTKKKICSFSDKNAENI